MLIALLATLAFAAVWFVALRPKAEPAAGGPVGPTAAVPVAEAGAAEAEAAAARNAAAADAAGAQTGAPAAPAAATPGAAPTAAAVPGAPTATPAEAAPKPALGRDKAAIRRQSEVLRDIARRKVVVMLFLNRSGADDREVRDAVRSLDRRGGRVAVHVAPIGRVGDYEAITRGVTVAQSPTVLVIGRDRAARMIVGLTEQRELQERVNDALAGR